MSDAVSPPPAEESAPAKGKGLLKKAKTAGILSAIVFVQCLAAYLLFPSAGENAASASPKAETASQEASHHAPTVREQTEVDLGAFSLTVYNPNANNNLLVDFHLYGTVMGGSGGEQPAEKEAAAGEEDDAAKLEKLLKGHKHRFRDQVIMIVRNSQITDLSDPGLGLLKRQILAKTNALLGEPLLKEVIFSDFVVVEQ
jgi:Flagellar basal body-associated protein FliL